MIAFRIEDVQPPLSLLYFLGNVQWVDAFNDQFDLAVARLARTIRESNKYPAPATVIQTSSSVRESVAAPALPTNVPGSHKRRSAIRMLAAAAVLCASVVLAGFCRSEMNCKRVAQAQKEFEQGKKYYDSGNLPYALAAFNSAIRTSGKCYLAYSYRAMLFHDMAEEQRALADANMAIHLNPNWPVAFRVRGDIDRSLKRYKAAVDDYSSAIRINSPDPRGISNIVLAYQGRAQAHQRLGETAAAKQDEARARSLQPASKIESATQVLART